MKNQRAVIVMALAVVFGLAAVALAAQWLLNAPAASAGRIVVAAADIDIGQRLAPEMVKLVDWPADSVPKGAFADPQMLAGRVLRTSVLAGEPLSEAKLAPAGTLGGLSALITEGKRAITVRVNDVIGVAGFALPGNYVDIIVSTETEAQPQAQGGQRERHISKIVLERILVLAVAQEVSRDETKPKVVNAVTLEVTPEQAEKLDLVAQRQRPSGRPRTASSPHLPGRPRRCVRWPCRCSARGRRRRRPRVHRRRRATASA